VNIEEFVVEPVALEKFIAQHKSTIIIDIRAAQSFDLVSIPNSINMPLEIFQKWIDGYTGDCLGAVEQLAECLILITFLALWKFM
jgi:rhodanese-related sulfurtransferase